MKKGVRVSGVKFLSLSTLCLLSLSFSAFAADTEGGTPMSPAELHKLEIEAKSKKSVPVAAVQGEGVPKPPPAVKDEIRESASDEDFCAKAGAPGSIEVQACECREDSEDSPRCHEMQGYVTCMQDHNGSAEAQTYCRCSSGIQRTGCA